MQRETKEKLIVLAGCFVLVFLLYGRSLWGDFVFDDRYVAQSQNFLQFNNLLRILASPYWTVESGLYRPVTLFSYALNYSFFGAGAWSFHLFNLIFYAWSGYLIFLLLARLFSKKWLAGFIATLFLVLPIHSEAVANIIGRAEILALFFSLLVFLELLKEKPSPSLVGLWFLLAISSKETAIAALPMGLMVWWVGRRSENVMPDLPARQSPNEGGARHPDYKTWIPAFAGMTKKLVGFLIKPFLAFFAAGLIYFTARWLILGREYFLGVETSLVENPLKFAPILVRIFTALKVLVIYLEKTFWPFNLCSDYSFNQIPVLKSFANWETILGVVFLLFFIAAVFFFWRRQPMLSFASAFFLFSYLPIANLILPIGTIAGERLMYYPSLGLVIWLGWGLAVLSRLPRQRIFSLLFWILPAALISFYGLRSYERSLDWLTEKKLFVSAAKCAPGSVLTRSNLGAVYYLAGDYSRAKEELLAAEQIYDSYPKGVNNLGLVYWKEGQKEKARQYFLRALSFKFPYYGAYENLALMALEEKKFDEARDWLLKFYSGNQQAVELYIGAYQEGAKNR